jgi:DNA repair exonuclease SbcCD ATPase subunit
MIARMITALEKEFDIDLNLLNRDNQIALMYDLKEVADHIKHAKTLKGKEKEEEIKVMTYADAVNSLDRWKEEQDSKKPACALCEMGVPRQEYKNKLKKV